MNVWLKLLHSPSISDKLSKNGYRTFQNLELARYAQTEIARQAQQNIHLANLIQGEVINYFSTRFNKD